MTEDVMEDAGQHGPCGYIDPIFVFQIPPALASPRIIRLKEAERTPVRTLAHSTRTARAPPSAWVASTAIQDSDKHG